MPDSMMSRSFQSAGLHRNSVKYAKKMDSSVVATQCDCATEKQNDGDSEQPEIKRPSTRAHSQMTLYSSKSAERRTSSPDQFSNNGRDETTMTALTEIEKIYKRLLDKHSREVRQLKKEIKIERQQILDLQMQKREVEQRAVEAERGKNVCVSKQTILENKVDDLEKTNAELEADIRLITKQYEELNTKYSELHRKDKTTEQNLFKALEKIKELEGSSKSRSSRREDHLKKIISNNIELIRFREREIEDLKRERNSVQRKSNYIKETLSSAKRANSVHDQR